MSARLADPDTTWIKSEKLDADVQEMILRAYDLDLAFPFRIRTRASADERIERSRPADLVAFIRDDDVVSIRCAPPATEAVSSDAWRSKVDDDVRTIHGAQSACWTGITIRFTREPSSEEWTHAVGMGLVVYARDARTSLVWAPVRAIPRLASLEFVDRIDPL